MAESKIKRIKKARFALPSLVTLGSAFCSFLSISFTLQAQTQTGDERLDLFMYAAFAIIGSVVFDTFDGKVARLVKASSKFGMELDSLSDCVSFGVAPAVLLYGFALHELGIIGLIAAFVYASGVLLRLARFNIQAPDEGVQTYFNGVPSSAGAAAVVAVVLACIDIGFTEFEPFHLNTIAVVSIIVGLLMVSNIKYKTLKGKKTKGDIVLLISAPVLFVLFCFLFSPAVSFFILVCGFFLYGMLLTVYLNLKQVPLPVHRRHPKHYHRDKLRKKLKAVTERHKNEAESESADKKNGAERKSDESESADKKDSAEKKSADTENTALSDDKKDINADTAGDKNHETEAENSDITVDEGTDKSEDHS